MRKYASFLVAIAMLFSTHLSFGQEQGDTQDHGGRHHGGRQQQAAQRLNQMATQLNLTDEQKEKIKPILTDQAQKLKALRDDTSMTRQDRFSKAKEINESAVQQMHPLLTPDQQQKYDAMRAQMKDEAKSRMREQRKDAPNQ